MNGYENYGTFSIKVSSAIGGNPTTGTPVFNITQAGNVGIGTTSPSVRLNTFLNDDLTTIQVRAETNTSSVVSYVGIAPSVIEYYRNVATGVDLTIQTKIVAAGGGGNIVFSPNSPSSDLTPVERMRITKDGYIGIATSGYSVANTLQLGRVFGLMHDINSGYIQANMTNSGNYYISQYATRIHLDSAIGEINFLTAASGTAGNAVSLVNRMQITNGGNIDTKGNAIYAHSGAFSMGGTYQTIFTSVSDSVYLISVNTNPSSGDGTYALLIAFNEGDKPCQTIAGNNILIQFSGNDVQIRSTNGSTYSVSWSATRIK
jgi:hypothetical protein